MTEMIERVARAMRKGLGVDWPYAGHEFLNDVAKAAIEEMRTPTDAMLEANAGRDPFSWEIMIDAALGKSE